MSYIVDTLTQGTAETDADFNTRVQTYVNDQLYYFMQVGGELPAPAPGSTSYLGYPPTEPLTDSFQWDVTNSQFVRKVTFVYENKYYYKFIGTTPPLPVPPPAPTVGDMAIFGTAGMMVDSTLAFDTVAMNWTNLSPATVNGQAVEYSQLAALIITPQDLTRFNDTNVTLTLGGTPSGALLQGVSLTLGWTGTLANSRIASAATWDAKTTLAAVNAQNLSAFSATTSAQLASVITDESGTGLLVFNDTPTLITPVIGVATGTSLQTTGAIRSSGTAGIGYVTGAGGTVTQATSKSTGVTLDKITGQVTMNNAALANGTTVSFTVTNSTVAAEDIVVPCITSGGTPGAYFYGVSSVSSGSFIISIRNVSGGSLSEAVVIKFAVIKSTTS